MNKKLHTLTCNQCNGTGKHPAATNETDKLASMCPFCAGTGQAPKLDAAMLAKLTLAPPKT